MLCRNVVQRRRVVCAGIERCDMSDKYYVEIIEHKTEKVIKRMGPMSARKAEKVDGGANINLDHEHYYTMIRSVDDER